MPYVFTVEPGAEGIRTRDVIQLTPLHVTFFGRCYAWRDARESAPALVVRPQGRAGHREVPRCWERGSDQQMQGARRPISQTGRGPVAARIRQAQGTVEHGRQQGHSQKYCPIRKCRKCQQYGHSENACTH